MREFATETERQIIGIVGDTRDGGLNRDPQPAMYIPQAQVPDAANALNVRISPIAWVVRTQGEPHAAQRADSGAAPAGDGTAGDQHPVDGGSRLALRRRVSGSTCG